MVEIVHDVLAHTYIILKRAVCAIASVALPKVRGVFVSNIGKLPIFTFVKKGSECNDMCTCEVHECCFAQG